jgi:hypothetical protein
VIFVPSSRSEDRPGKTKKAAAVFLAARRQSELRLVEGKSEFVWIGLIDEAVRLR